jgi:hypothetical protein
MPLSPAADRELLHTRGIVIRGYRRTDGRFDIEAQLSDTKAYGFGNQDRGFIEAGEPVHFMWLRLTVDEHMTIVASEAATEHGPYTICPSAAPNFSRLAGLRIKPGFMREANQRVGGAIGCTHLRELLQQIATTAFQTINPYRAFRDASAAGEAGERGSDRLDARVSEKMGGSAKIVDTCIAYARDGAIVRRRWPHLYTGPDQPDASAVAAD